MALAERIITYNDARDHIGAEGVDASMQSALEGYIDSLTPVIEGFVGPVVSRVVTEVVDGGEEYLDLRGRADTVTSIEHAGGTLASTDYWVDDDGNVRAGSVFAARTFPAGRIRIVYRTGYPSTEIPENIRLAALELVAHWWRQGRVSGRSTRFPGADGDLAQPSGYGVPYRVHDLLRPHLRVKGIA